MPVTVVHGTVSVETHGLDVWARELPLHLPPDNAQMAHKVATASNDAPTTPRYKDTPDRLATSSAGVQLDSTIAWYACYAFPTDRLTQCPLLRFCVSTYSRTSLHSPRAVYQQSEPRLNKGEWV